jgi:hypothetical protein
MKRIYSALFLITVLIPFFLTTVYGKSTLAINHKKVMGDFIMSIRDFKLNSQSSGQNELDCQPSAIEFKPEHQGDVQHLSAQEFCQLWDNGTSFNTMPPNATLVFHQGGDMYQMIFKVPAVTQSANAPTVLIHANTFDDSASFTKNGVNISRDDFMTASESQDKTNISLLIDSDPWDPRH